MLGSVPEAEDVVQDVWLGWNAMPLGEVADPEAWLVTTTTRRSIDRLRLARVHREHYVGIWLPEPVITDSPITPEELQESASDLSLAFLIVLERLAPEARAAYLLREVFDADYPDIAATLGKSEAACRQIVHRAKSQLREERPRYVVSAAAHQRLMQRFTQAWSNADFKAMKNMMAESATLVGDGGGIVTSFPKPMVGGTRIAQLLFACTLRRRHELRLEPAWINGRPGLLRYFGDALESAQSFDTDGERILRVYVQRNPQKLRMIQSRRNVVLN
ncbi:sigma-70 family RNA polymerase sigma factor [Pseudoxanthomonas sp.]|uniref:sigma-70 family RNA polymerase sigma factor n=1 Tax=Pseudoxanthomonas sp. TaxID=1871049 RepID=UPI002615B574|nr:sigma-70 family RNA polymerase sigma factor [Pseudoxanthomonas sp.]WDS36985.1 MAG: sigma-70 family RNA polymerase sigma factor [Pseudoxanthomonas sp.]